jgi:uncharacterized protein
MMKINVLQVKREIGARQFFSFMPYAKEIGLAEEREWAHTQFSVKGEVINNGRLLEVAGAIEGQARFACNRCLEEFSAQVTIPFSENFQELTEELKQADDSEYTYYQGDELDITELVREYLLLAEPMKTLCREDCQGLCLKCGANLNLTSCSCLKGVIDPRLAALQQFLEKDKL